jgi:hypothetical protein
MRVRMATTYGPLTVEVPGGGWSTQYSANAQSTIAGIGLSVYTAFNNFTVTVQNGVVIGFSVYFFNGGNGILAPSPSISGTFSCTVNGITPPFVNNTTSFNQTITYTSPADGPPPVTVNFSSSTTGSVFTQSATASYSVTYGLYAQTKNLVFSSHDPSLTHKLVFLEPITSLNNGKLIAIKDKSFQAGSMYTVIYAPPGIQSREQLFLPIFVQLCMRMDSVIHMLLTLQTACIELQIFIQLIPSHLYQQ